MVDRPRVRPLNEDLEPVVDLLQLVLNGHADQPRDLARLLVTALVETPGMAHRLTLAHLDWRAENP